MLIFCQIFFYFYSRVPSYCYSFLLCFCFPQNLFLLYNTASLNKSPAASSTIPDSYGSLIVSFCFQTFAIRKCDHEVEQRVSSRQPVYVCVWTTHIMSFLTKRMSALCVCLCVYECVLACGMYVSVWCFLLHLHRHALTRLLF